MRVLWWRGGGMDTLILDSSVWHMGSHRVVKMLSLLEFDACGGRISGVSGYGAAASIACDVGGAARRRAAGATSSPGR